MVWREGIIQCLSNPPNTFLKYDQWISVNHELPFAIQTPSKESAVQNGSNRLAKKKSAKLLKNF
jgi:hypothetical protein